jgi:hypothetical protein
VLAAEPAELLVFNATGLLLLVLRGRIIPSFALAALKCYDFSHVDDPLE